MLYGTTGRQKASQSRLSSITQLAKEFRTIQSVELEITADVRTTIGLKKRLSGVWPFRVVKQQQQRSRFAHHGEHAL